MHKQRDTAFKTLNTPRLFANAIRRARRLAVRTSARPNSEVAEVKQISCPKIDDQSFKPSKHSRETNEDGDRKLKRQCAVYSGTREEDNTDHTFSTNAMLIKSQAHQSVSCSVQNLCQPSDQQPNFCNISAHSAFAAKREFLRTLLMSVSSKLSPVTRSPPTTEGVGGACGLESSAFLQGAVWAAAICQKPLPMHSASILLPTHSMALPTMATTTAHLIHAHQPNNGLVLSGGPSSSRPCWPVAV